MLDSAELRALAAVHARAVGPEPDLVVMPRNEVLLSTEIRHPEAVDHVVRDQADPKWAAEWDVNLVGEMNTILRDRVFVLDFPPPLMTGAAWAQTDPTATANAAPTAASTAVQPACANPNALGVSRACRSRTATRN